MARDKRYDDVFLTFTEEGHKYSDNLGNTYTSVTTLIHDNYIPKFDKKYWLRKKAKEEGISEKALEKRWQAITEEACTRGTATHNGIEDAIKEVSQFKNAIKYLTDIKSGRVVTVADLCYFKAKPLDIEEFKKATCNKYTPIYDVFETFINNGYTIYSEIGAFLIDYKISGTIDILCVRDTDFAILDWKTNRNGLQFTSGYYKKDKSVKPEQLTNEWVSKPSSMLAPLSNLPDCNGSHYTMQLSLYAKMVELILGIPCTGLALCHIASPFVKNKYGMPLKNKHGQYPIDPTGVETCKWYRLPYKSHEADLVLTDRELKLKAELIASGKNQYSLNL